MLRGLLIVLITLVVLIATVVGVVRAGLYRLAIAQRAANASWHPEPKVSPTPPTTAPALVAADVQEPIPTFESIDLWAKDATLHGGVQVMDARTGRAHTVEPPKEGRALLRWQQRQAMSGRAITTYLSGFRTADDYAEWPIAIPKPGDYEIDLTYACPKWEEGGHFTVRVGDKELPLAIEATRYETAFRVVPIGKLTLPAGNATLTLRAAPASVKSPCFMNMRSIEIIPAPATDSH
ncbi:MAG TPA: hypothetical protein VFE47_12890 [Tepidisphaeraceae bacterium]|nr:hypothetical protein [Tepidisphaeraceae bacterium]